MHCRRSLSATGRNAQPYYEHIQGYGFLPIYYTPFFLSCQVTYTKIMRCTPRALYSPKRIFLFKRLYMRIHYSHIPKCSFCLLITVNFLLVNISSAFLKKSDGIRSLSRMMVLGHFECISYIHTPLYPA